jgi:hypothetical protein
VLFASTAKINVSIRFAGLLCGHLGTGLAENDLETRINPATVLICPLQNLNQILPALAAVKPLNIRQNFSSSEK